MSLAVVNSRGLAGLDAPRVIVEVHLAGGLPAFNLVGLPDTEVKESRDRVRAALQNAQFEFPARKITVNLAPADLPKESGRFPPVRLAATSLRVSSRSAVPCAPFVARSRWRFVRAAMGVPSSYLRQAPPKLRWSAMPLSIPRRRFSRFARTSRAIRQFRRSGR
jgi:hypothetical protein